MLFFLMLIDIKLMAAGVMPSNLPAWPSVDGWLFVNLSTTSFDKPFIKV